MQTVSETAAPRGWLGTTGALTGGCATAKRVTALPAPGPPESHRRAKTSRNHPRGRGWEDLVWRAAAVVGADSVAVLTAPLRCGRSLRRRQPDQTSYG